jgi:cytochrome P450
MGFTQNNCQTFLKVLECYCRMSAIAVGNQRKTVKDMVIAGYQVPKGEGLYK